MQLTKIISLLSLVMLLASCEHFMHMKKHEPKKKNERIIYRDLMKLNIDK